MKRVGPVLLLGVGFGWYVPTGEHRETVLSLAVVSPEKKFYR